MSKTKYWERTAVQGLLRNASSGGYYGRWKIAGKQKWLSLDTDVFSVAKLRHRDETAKVERQRGARSAVASGVCVMADLMTTYEEVTNRNEDLKPASRAARLVALKKIKKTWPELSGMKPAQVTPAAVADWAARLKNDGTQFTPPGAKTVLRGNSHSSVNRAIDALRRLMALAVQRGAASTNPIVSRPVDGERLKKKVTKKKLVLPSNEGVQRIFRAMETNGARGGWGIEAADFCRFLSFSGCRIAEAAASRWADVDWEKKQLAVHGTKSDTSERIVPLFADLEALLKKLIERRKSAARFAVDGKPYLNPTDSIFRLSECQKTIDTACTAAGVDRITHHDFRHLFATRCIESGVDIPTVSRWLGHSDGGALAMKTYGHLRQEHSAAQALRVSFA